MVRTKQKITLSYVCFLFFSSSQLTGYYEFMYVAMEMFAVTIKIIMKTKARSQHLHGCYMPGQCEAERFTSTNVFFLTAP